MRRHGEATACTHRDAGCQSLQLLHVNLAGCRGFICEDASGHPWKPLRELLRQLVQDDKVMQRRFPLTCLDQSPRVLQDLALEHAFECHRLVVPLADQKGKRSDQLGTMLAGITEAESAQVFHDGVGLVRSVHLLRPQCVPKTRREKVRDGRPSLKLEPGSSKSRSNRLHAASKRPIARTPGDPRRKSRRER